MPDAQIIDGKAESKRLLQTLSHQITELKGHGTVPCLAVIMVGDDPASHVYVRNKAKTAEEIGVQSLMFNLSTHTTQDSLLGYIDMLNQSDQVHGILVQLPLPPHISKHAVINAIAPEKDVDGFHIDNVGLLVTNGGGIIPCTPMGCLMLIKKHLGHDLTGKKAVVVGCSTIVGKPIATLLLHEHCSIAMCHEHTKDIEAECSTADILVVATGVAKLVKKDWVKPGAVIIDVGINRLPDGKLCGDVDFDAVKEVAGAITPVPGGVGPMTIACLMHNTVMACARQRGITLTHDSGIFR
jgi:methylenetetrahydrofolate dehydrogenase (NADP+)/methenyltetrahydrofolate cyclohydrolase